eukprot:02270_4
MGKPMEGLSSFSLFLQIIFIIFVTIIMLNVLIAQLSLTYGNVMKFARPSMLKYRASVILDLESLLPSFSGSASTTPRLRCPAAAFGQRRRAGWGYSSVGMGISLPRLHSRPHQALHGCHTRGPLAQARFGVVKHRGGKRRVPPDPGDHLRARGIPSPFKYPRS